jgi:hypothetical protein
MKVLCHGGKLNMLPNELAGATERCGLDDI